MALRMPSMMMPPNQTQGTDQGEGIYKAEVDLATGEGLLRYDPAQADPAAVLRSLDPLGYQGRLS